MIEQQIMNIWKEGMHLTQNGLKNNVCQKQSIARNHTLHQHDGETLKPPEYSFRQEKG